MKKVFLLISCAALLGMGAVSCKKDSEFNKGKDAAKAYCDCLKSESTDCSAQNKFSLTADFDWLKGWNEGMESCNWMEE